MMVPPFRDQVGYLWQSLCHLQKVKCVLSGSLQRIGGALLQLQLTVICMWLKGA